MEPCTSAGLGPPQRQLPQLVHRPPGPRRRGRAISTRAARTGTAVYTGERWGDYVGMAQDPQVPNQVWDANEYSGGADWLTKVTPLQTAGTTYVPITPLRVLDTRFSTGLTGMFTSGAARSWQVGGIGADGPGKAVAVTGNVTVTGQQSAGYVSVTVTPTSSPPSSTINFPAGDLARTTSRSALLGGQAVGGVQGRRRARRRTSCSTSPATSWRTSPARRSLR